MSNSVFAKLADDGKTVVNIIAFDKAKTIKNNKIQEAVGQGYLYRTHGWPAVLWKLSTVDKVPYRKNTAGIGYTYDSTRDAFITPKPYPSWTLNETTCQYEAPVPIPISPQDEKGGLLEHYTWNESTQTWITYTNLPI